MDIIKKRLYELQDLKYRDFTAKLVPNIDKERIIGVRTPELRKFAKEIKNEKIVIDFLSTLPHDTHEENILHGILLSYSSDINYLFIQLDKFLPFADSWAVTDVISPKLFKKYPDVVYKKILEWLKSEHEYVVRFAVVSLLQFFLDDFFKEEELLILSKINSDYFYVNMAIAWFYSFALIKQYDSTIKYFEDKKLNIWVHNKSLQKAIESYRITDDKKSYLRSLKIYVKKSK